MVRHFLKKTETVQKGMRSIAIIQADGASESQVNAILVNLAVIEFDALNAALKCRVCGLSCSSRLVCNDPWST